MSRKKDKIKQKHAFLKKNKNLGKSPLDQNKLEKEKEILFLKKIKNNLPTELIKIIFDFMTGNAKILCNFKFQYLEKLSHTLEFYFKFDIIEELTKKELIDFIFKGVIKNYPDLMELINDNVYCLDTHSYSNVKGKQLFYLWEKNLLEKYDEEFYEEFNEGLSFSNIDWSIKYYTKNAIYYYIKNVIILFEKIKLKIKFQKFIYTENKIFLNIDKVFYIYKCIENLNYLKNNN